MPGHHRVSHGVTPHKTITVEFLLAECLTEYLLAATRLIHVGTSCYCYLHLTDSLWPNLVTRYRVNLEGQQGAIIKAAKAPLQGSGKVKMPTHNNIMQLESMSWPLFNLA